MVRRYSRNASGDEVYPQRKDGSERYAYLPGRTPLFARDRYGSPRYARDASGAELYPAKCEYPKNLLVEPSTGFPAYARDALGNETYPKTRDGLEMPAVTAAGEMVVARYASGRQRYPADRHGNQYFPLWKATGRPYYLLDEWGAEYRPVTARGYEIALRKESVAEKTGGGREDSPHEYRDALGSTVYTRDPKMKSSRVRDGRIEEGIMDVCSGMGCFFFLLCLLC